MKNNQPPPLGWPAAPPVTGQQVADVAVVTGLVAVLAFAARTVANIARRSLR